MTRSLQHKHELIDKAKTQNALRETLNILDDSQRLSPVRETVDVLAEPSAALPLWRRVDRRFWWNEWLSKPFIDNGVTHNLCSRTMFPSDRGRMHSFIHMSCPSCKAFTRYRLSPLRGNLSPSKKATPPLWNTSSFLADRGTVLA